MAASGLRRLARGFFRRWTAPLGLVIFLLVIAMAVSAPYVFREDPFAMVTRPMQGPGENRAYILGSDMLGRDILAGIFHGARVSLAIGGAATAAALSAGVLIGALAGASLADWPIGFSQLEPFYREAEEMIGLSGGDAPLPEGRKTPFPNGPLLAHPSADLLHRGPRGVPLASPRSRPSRCAHRDASARSGRPPAE